MDKISIIVPVYNVEKYISKSIDSIISQTYKNIEVLLIDDGSKDKSGKICDNYSKLDSRISVYHKKNGGLSDARNYGIDRVKGKYVCFIDSDDYIDKDYIEKLYNSIKKTGADIACAAKKIESDDNSKEKNNNNDWTVDNITALEKMCMFDDIDNSACDKLFKISLFKNIRFPLGRYYEDIVTIFYVVYSSKSVTHVKNTFYHYMTRDNSISKSDFSEKHLDLLLMSKEVKYFFNKEKSLAGYCDAFYYVTVMSLALKILSSTNRKKYMNEYEKIRKEFSKKIFEVVSNKAIPSYKKIMIFLIICRLGILVNLVKRRIKNED